MTFVNHGCNGTSNLGVFQSIGTETTVDISTIHHVVMETEPYNPFERRRFPSSECASIVAWRDIQPGEELFDDYIAMGGSTYWAENLNELRSLCSGDFGTVSQYENKNLP
jgi:SET domain